jgi:hypothetical protein
VLACENARQHRAASSGSVKRAAIRVSTPSRTEASTYPSASSAAFGRPSGELAERATQPTPAGIAAEAKKAGAGGDKEPGQVRARTARILTEPLPKLEQRNGR